MPTTPACVREFQSTLPAGEATHKPAPAHTRRPISIHASRGGSDHCKIVGVPGRIYFNPRFPRGKRRIKGIRVGLFCISIHASREGSDLPPAGAAAPLLPISIHASREGSDSGPSAKPFYPKDFNPRFPRGKRLRTISEAILPQGFQSTLPAREATMLPAGFNAAVRISIHASREGSDAGQARRVSKGG